MFSRSPNDTDDNHLWYGNDSGRGQQPNLYPHNTYHGPSPHYRTPLNPADFKLLRFTDSPQHYYGLKTSPGSNEPTSQVTSSLARNNSATGLRRSSNGSSDEEVSFWGNFLPRNSKITTFSSFEQVATKFPNIKLNL